MRECIFCGRKESTIEDAWPIWLMRHFPASSNGTMFAEYGSRQTSWRLRKPKLTVKKLCSKCNNEWMSQLENKVKPIIESIFEVSGLILDTSMQTILAKWAVKTAIVLESIDSERSSFYSENDRNLMCMSQTIPIRTTIWMAKCINNNSIYSAAKDHRTTLDSDGFHAYVTTMAFGSIAFQVVSIRTPAKLPENVPVTYDVSDGPWDETLMQIWPIKKYSLEWPNKIALNGESGLELLRERLTLNK